MARRREPGLAGIQVMGVSRGPVQVKLDQINSFIRNDTAGRSRNSPEGREDSRRAPCLGCGSVGAGTGQMLPPGVWPTTTPLQESCPLRCSDPHQVNDEEDTIITCIRGINSHFIVIGTKEGKVYLYNVRTEALRGIPTADKSPVISLAGQISKVGAVLVAIASKRNPIDLYYLHDPDSTEKNWQSISISSKSEPSPPGLEPDSSSSITHMSLVSLEPYSEFKTLLFYVCGQRLLYSLVDLSSMKDSNDCISVSQCHHMSVDSRLCHTFQCAVTRLTGVGNTLLACHPPSISIGQTMLTFNISLDALSDNIKMESAILESSLTSETYSLACFDKNCESNSLACHPRVVLVGPDLEDCGDKELVRSSGKQKNADLICNLRPRPGTDDDSFKHLDNPFNNTLENAIFFQKKLTSGNDSLINAVTSSSLLCTLHSVKEKWVCSVFNVSSNTSNPAGAIDESGNNQPRSIQAKLIHQESFPVLTLGTYPQICVIHAPEPSTSMDSTAQIVFQLGKGLLLRSIMHGVDKEVSSTCSQTARADIGGETSSVEDEQWEGLSRAAGDKISGKKSRNVSIHESRSVAQIDDTDNSKKAGSHISRRDTKSSLSSFPYGPPSVSSVNTSNPDSISVHLDFESLTISQGFPISGSLTADKWTMYNTSLEIEGISLLIGSKFELESSALDLMDKQPSHRPSICEALPSVHSNGMSGEEQQTMHGKDSGIRSDSQMDASTDEPVERELLDGGCEGVTMPADEEATESCEADNGHNSDSKMTRPKGKYNLVLIAKDSRDHLYRALVDIEGDACLEFHKINISGNQVNASGCGRVLWRHDVVRGRAQCRVLRHDVPGSKRWSDFASDVTFCALVGDIGLVGKDGEVELHPGIRPDQPCNLTPLLYRHCHTESVMNAALTLTSWTSKGVEHGHLILLDSHRKLHFAATKDIASPEGVDVECSPIWCPRGVQAFSPVLTGSLSRGCQRLVVLDTNNFLLYTPNWLEQPVPIWYQIGFQHIENFPLSIGSEHVSSCSNEDEVIYSWPGFGLGQGKVMAVKNTIWVNLSDCLLSRTGPFRVYRWTSVKWTPQKKKGALKALFTSSKDRSSRHGRLVGLCVRGLNAGDVEPQSIYLLQSQQDDRSGDAASLHAPDLQLAVLTGLASEPQVNDLNMPSHDGRLRCLIQGPRGITCVLTQSGNLFLRARDQPTWVPVNQLIYSHRSGGGTDPNTSCQLKSIHLSLSHAWAIDFQGYAYFCNDLSDLFRVVIPEQSDHDLLLIWNEIVDPYCQDGAAEPVRFDQIAASMDGSTVWGIGIDQLVYSRQAIYPDLPQGSNWCPVPGLVGPIQISASRSGVWFIGASEKEIYRRSGLSPTNWVGEFWENVPTPSLHELVCLSVTECDEAWCIDSQQHIYRLHRREDVNLEI